MTSTTEPARPATSGATAPSGLTPMSAAKAPIGIGPVPTIGIVLSIAVVALGVVGIRDALVYAGAVDGTPWIESVADGVDGWQPQLWHMLLGALLVLIGLWLVFAALRPRPRTGIAVRAQTGVYLRNGDVERLSKSAASDCDGVLSADADASRRKVEVKIAITGGSATAEGVRAAVQEALEPLETRPDVRIKIIGGKP